MDAAHFLDIVRLILREKAVSIEENWSQGTLSAGKICGGLAFENGGQERSLYERNGRDGVEDHRMIGLYVHRSKGTG
jgi:hypothetical protein